MTIEYLKSFPKITEPLVDHRGNEIKPGVRVAYNWSGELACGIVVSATPAIKQHWDTIKRAKIVIEMEHPVGLCGKKSTVQSPKNVMVIS